MSLSTFEALDQDMPKLLIVDDDPDALDELADAMCEFGWTVHTANSAENALTVFSAVPGIGVVLTDHFLRGPMIGSGSGLELVELIRALPHGKNTEFFVMSGDPDVSIDCALFGGLQFAPKPLAPGSIHEQICARLAERDGSVVEPQSPDQEHGNNHK